MLLKGSDDINLDLNEIKIWLNSARTKITRLIATYEEIAENDESYFLDFI